jgi:superfamily II DNA or RNA helicase
MSQTLLRPRDYQTDAIERVFKAWREGMQRPAVVMATGLGKTVVFSHLARCFIDVQTGPLDALRVRPQGAARVVILVHRDELADQTLAKLAVVAPELDCGKVKAADNDITADVMVCSVQTLARENRARQLLDAQTFAGAVGLVIVDECHHAVADSYRNIMAALGCYDSDSPAVAVGFTATLARGDSRGLGDVWQDAVYKRGVLKGIESGHLVDVRARTVDLEELDLGAVRRSGGDFTAKSLGDALMEADAPAAIRQTIVQHAADRRSIIVFTPTVEVAHAVVAELTSANIWSEIVHGGTPRDMRLAAYERFRTGRTRVLVNCMVLTEGADFPHADCAVIARPTRNETLFIQMVGRVLRPSPVTGKRDALVLMLTGQNASLRTLIDLEPDIIVPVLEDESLTEAYDRQERIREEQEAAHDRREAHKPRHLRLKTTDVDLFSSSPAYQWLRTEKGVLFIPLGGSGEILLWPSQAEGLWDVVHAPEDPATRRRGPWVRLHTALDNGMAMAWGESEAEERSLINTGRKAAWRKKPASAAQRGHFALRGREVPEDARAGEVGDMISVALASRVIDRYVAHARA